MQIRHALALAKSSATLISGEPGAGLPVSFPLVCIRRCAAREEIEKIAAATIWIPGVLITVVFTEGINDVAGRIRHRLVELEIDLAVCRHQARQQKGIARGWSDSADVRSLRIIPVIGFVVLERDG